MTRPTDNINPQHYRQYPVEAIEVIEEMHSPLLANCVKYCWRLGDKGGPDKTEEDRNKTLWYFDRWANKYAIPQGMQFTARQDASVVVTDMLRNDIKRKTPDNGDMFFRSLDDYERETLRYVEKTLNIDHSHQVGRLLAIKNHMPEKRLRVISTLVALDANIRIDLDTGTWSLSATPGPGLRAVIREAIEKL